MQVDQELSYTQDKAFIRIVTSGGHDNVVFVVRDVRNELGVRVSDCTIRRVLKRAGLLSRVEF